jgi:hypothetical protein
MCPDRRAWPWDWFRRELACPLERPPNAGCAWEACCECLRLRVNARKKRRGMLLRCDSKHRFFGNRARAHHTANTSQTYRTYPRGREGDFISWRRGRRRSAERRAGGGQGDLIATRLMIRVESWMVARGLIAACDVAAVRARSRASSVSPTMRSVPKSAICAANPLMRYQRRWVFGSPDRSRLFTVEPAIMLWCQSGERTEALPHGRGGRLYEVARTG